jgi:hypothetical protein
MLRHQPLGHHPLLAAMQVMVLQVAHASRDLEDLGAADMVDDADMASNFSGVAEVVHADIQR